MEGTGRDPAIARPRCSHCRGILLADLEADELVCFSCSRRFRMDGSTTRRQNVKPSRGDERIAGMKF